MQNSIIDILPPGEMNLNVSQKFNVENCRHLPIVNKRGARSCECEDMMESLRHLTPMLAVEALLCCDVLARYLHPKNIRVHVSGNV